MNTEGNKRWCLASLWGLIAAVMFPMIVFALVIARPHAPRYAGRSAERWLRGVVGTARNSASQTAAIAAFREMGTNGIGFLVKSLNRRDHAWSRLYQQIYPKLPSVMQRLPPPLKADTLVEAACLVLLNLRDDAPEQTVTGLVRLLSAENPLTRLDAAVVLQYYTRTYPALDLASFRPDLLRALSDTNDWTRIQVATALRNAKLGGPECIAALQPALTNRDVTLQMAARLAIHQLETTARIGENNPLTPAFDFR